MRRRRALLRATLLLWIALAGCAAAAEPTPFVLPPQAMPVLAQLCERLKPSVHCDDVSIDHDRIELRLCSGPDGETACFRVRLESPAVECAQTRWGPFCTTFIDPPPSQAARTALTAVLQSTPPDGLWTTVAPAAAPSPSGDSVGPSPAVQARGLATAALLSGIPLALGWTLGRIARTRAGGRFGGIILAFAVVAAPAAASLWVDMQLTLIGAWDALLVGAMFGAGVLLAAHRGCADWRNVALLCASTAASLTLLELACRLVLPPPPAFPSSEGPALFLSDAMRAAERTGYAPTQAGITTCDEIYGEPSGRNATPPTTFPSRWQPRADTTAHVLHLGDSMVFGSSADGRFTDDLDRLEPDVEHVNAAIAGTAPDVYLILARLFIAQHDFDAVIMHLTGNDFWGVDERQYPCSDWLPLLVYDGPHTRLRFAEPQHDDAARDSRWRFVETSPPPFVLRAGVRVSALAAYAAAAFVHFGRQIGTAPGEVPDAERVAHLRAILRDARDELAARHIPLLVDSFHDRQEVESGIPTEHGAEDAMQQIAQELGIVTLDTWQPLIAAEQRGVQPFTNAGGPTDSHFNAAGHALIAAWLHETLPDAVARARAAAPPADR